jgi:hypothetical protein
LGWQLEEGYMRRYTAAWNCTQEPAHRFAGELQGVLKGIKPLSATTSGEQHTSSLQGEVVDSAQATHFWNKLNRQKR